MRNSNVRYVSKMLFFCDGGFVMNFAPHVIIHCVSLSRMRLYTKAHARVCDGRAWLPKEVLRAKLRQLRRTVRRWTTRSWF